MRLLHLNSFELDTNPPQGRGNNEVTLHREGEFLDLPHANVKSKSPSPCGRDLGRSLV